jgi:CheY-like chemotaxis protein
MAQAFGDERGRALVAGQKCALIVDDSRTARQVLGRLLSAHELRVDTSESAEDALDYLSNERPDVIFMDHMMPGMDGFQAVRAIKNNPATATIPIMMYTSQEGEVYVGQARALGAVGVLPKQIKPVEVTEILKSLHLIPGGEGAQNDGSAVAPDAATPSAGIAPTLAEVGHKMEVADWSELHDWLREMLNQHSQSLKEDIERSMRRLLSDRRGNRPDRRTSAEDRRQGPADRREADRVDPAGEPPGIPPGGVREPERRQTLTTAGLLGLGMLSVVLLGLQIDTQRELQKVNARNGELAAALEWQRNDRATFPGGMNGAEDADALAQDQYLDFLTALEWTVNQSGTYEPGEVPLGDERVEWLNGLVARLRAIGFSGVLQIDTHVGDFCEVADGAGGFSIAPDDLPIVKCERLGLGPEEALRMSARQSVRFANYVAALQTDPVNVVGVEIAALGNTAPVAPYPPNLPGIPAGDWNRVARENNRVQVTFLPD